MFILLLLQNYAHVFIQHNYYCKIDYKMYLFMYPIKTINAIYWR